MNNFQKDDLIILNVSLNEMIIGEFKSFNDNKIILNNPSEFKLVQYNEKLSPTFIPLGIFSNKIFTEIEIKKNKCLYISKANNEIKSFYEQFRKYFDNNSLNNINNYFIIKDKKINIQ